ncbi:MAG: lectin-like protein [Candidatus Cloacimonadaceae bacterium]|nr:lectin-like protein [Candidatus Cloacimonadaceae bacterium]
MKTKRYLIFLCMMLVLCCGIFTHLFAVIASAPESPYPANGANGVQLQDLRLQWSQTSVSNNQPYQYSLNMWGSPKTITGYTYKFSASGTHYYLSNGTDTWQNAKTICNNNKWRIGCAHNASINSSMQTNNGGAAAYIGLSDWITEGSFRWENGRALSYTNWAAGEPNDDGGAGDYVEMYPNGTWNDIGTQTRRYWIEVDSWVTHTQTTGNNYFDLNCKLDPNTTYTWSVYTRNNDGQGPTSTWSFTTDADGTAPSSYPAWGSPDSEVANAPLNPTLTWAPVNEATYYKLFVFRSRTDRLGIQHAFINGHVYQKTTTTLNYADAKAAAEANGGHLVTINDAAEQAILPTDFNYWIGLNDVSGQVLVVKDGLSGMWAKPMPIQTGISTPNHPNPMVKPVKTMWCKEPAGSGMTFQVPIPTDPCLSILQTCWMA